MYFVHYYSMPYSLKASTTPHTSSYSISFGDVLEKEIDSNRHLQLYHSKHPKAGVPSGHRVPYPMHITKEATLPYYKAKPNKANTPKRRAGVPYSWPARRTAAAPLLVEDGVLEVALAVLPEVDEAPDVVAAPLATPDGVLLPHEKLWQKFNPARLLAELLTHCPTQLSHSRDGRVSPKLEMLGVVPVAQTQLYVSVSWQEKQISYVRGA